jgi:hypothetical protein
MLRDYDPLDQLLQKWKKPVLYVTRNREHYTQTPMNEEDKRFKAWLKAEHPHVKLLLNEEVSIGGVNFFGGTMWTGISPALTGVLSFAKPGGWNSDHPAGIVAQCSSDKLSSDNLLDYRLCTP